MSDARRSRTAACGVFPAAQKKNVSSACADFVGELGAKLLQSKFGQFDVAVRDGLSQGHAAGEVEDLEDLRAPDEAIFLLGQTHAAELGAEFGIGELTGGLAPAAGGGDFGFVEADFGVLFEGFGDEVTAGDSSFTCGEERWHAREKGGREEKEWSGVS
jgi:hypothetical protein